jgi:hypothetical protein
MIIPPKEFFQFCAKHVALLRELEQRASGTDLSEAEIANIVQNHALESDEQPGFVAKQLKVLRILVSTDQSEGYFLMAEPVRAILRYLLEEAKPASSQTVQSYINQIQKLAQKLRDALAVENATLADLALADTTQALRRLHDDVSATHVSVLGEVARYKTDKRPSSVLEKYQRIVWWMQEYIGPMLEVIRVDGPMQATFGEVEDVLENAARNALVVSLDAAERNLRLVRVTRRHALNVFEQCGKEISPLYQSLARSSNLATGAAWALDRLRRGTIEEWTAEAVVGVFGLHQQEAFSDKAIIGAVERFLNNPPAPPPTINRALAFEKPAAMQHRQWLNSLPDAIAGELPILDMLGWLTSRYPELNTQQLLAGFSTLFFHERFRGKFTGQPIRDYETPQHLIRAHPVRLETTSK